MSHINNYNEVLLLKERIKNESALYYYRSTPFTEHCEFNYNGVLKEEFFFENMFSEKGRCYEYTNTIINSLDNHKHKSILLLGNQGCGKTTFVHHLARKNANCDFLFFDFDENTSNTKLEEYREKLSSHLHELLKCDNETNVLFYDIYVKNRNLINSKINGNNNINIFFGKFHNVFLKQNHSRNQGSKEDFLKDINGLFFNQILSLITLWYMCKLKKEYIPNKKIRPKVFCLDNLDVLVNKEIVENFFKEYFLFVRNVDSIIQNIKDEFFNKIDINYNQLFSFVFCCRKHTWARVREHYRHSNTFVRVSTLELDITDAFIKTEILSKREQYILSNSEYNDKFKNDVSTIRALLSDMDTQEERSHNIYDLFDDDYRQCIITFDELISENPDIVEKYFNVKKSMQKSMKTNRFMNKTSNGARGIIYKAIFDKFKNEGIFQNIGVLELSLVDPLVSNARLLLNYLNYYTHSENKNNQQHISFDKIVTDFDGLIKKDEIDKSLIAMFKLGDDSFWNELIGFIEIHDEELTSCEGHEVFITKAGYEYLSLMATHFEFFNTRVVVKRKVNVALFDDISILYSDNEKFKYNFQEIICNVKDIVNNCCKNMSVHYEKNMSGRFKSKDAYLKSPFVYGDAKVLHGERIIHTHIRYIDQYRLYILKTKNESINKKEINEIIVKYIEEYIDIGEKNPGVLTEKSTEGLFPAFKEKIKIIRDSNFEDFSTRIDY